jgi:3-hydroxyisobutyrate dehydrogenase-like beta-hydroxyacid dehydrogenase
MNPNASIESIGLIGLGLVGTALAERLTGAGWEVVGYDVDERRFAAMPPARFRPAASPREVAAQSRRIFLSLPNSAVVEEVIEGTSGVLPGCQPDTLIIDTTTADPERSAALAGRLREQGVAFLDATISGSSEQVRRGEVVVLVGGDSAWVDAAAGLFRTFSTRFYHLGGPGAGATAKLVVNLVLGLNRLALAEGLALGERTGLDTAGLLEVLRASAAYSRVMDLKGEKMLHGDFTPHGKLAQHLKDVHLILDLGQRRSVPLPLSQLHAQLLTAAVAAGHGEEDNSAVIQLWREGLLATQK